MGVPKPFAQARDQLKLLAKPLPCRDTALGPSSNSAAARPPSGLHLLSLQNETVRFPAFRSCR
jgi:hypothetical protein